MKIRLEYRRRNKEGVCSPYGTCIHFGMINNFTLVLRQVIMILDKAVQAGEVEDIELTTIKGECGCLGDKE